MVRMAQVLAVLLTAGAFVVAQDTASPQGSGTAPDNSQSSAGQGSTSSQGSTASQGSMPSTTDQQSQSQDTGHPETGACILDWELPLSRILRSLGPMGGVSR